MKQRFLLFFPRLETTKLTDPNGAPVVFLFTEDVDFTATEARENDFNGSITGTLEIPKEMAALIIPGAQVLPDGATVSIKFIISLIEMAFVPDPSS